MAAIPLQSLCREEAAARSVAVPKRRAIMRRDSLAWVVAGLAVLLTPAYVAAQDKASKSEAKPAKATPSVPRTADGKPEFSGGWQACSDPGGTWSEGQQGGCVSGTRLP